MPERFSISYVNAGRTCFFCALIIPHFLWRITINDARFFLVGAFLLLPFISNPERKKFHDFLWSMHFSKHLSFTFSVEFKDVCNNMGHDYAITAFHQITSALFHCSARKCQGRIKKSVVIMDSTHALFPALSA